AVLAPWAQSFRKHFSSLTNGAAPRIFLPAGSVDAWFRYRETAVLYRPDCRFVSDPSCISPKPTVRRQNLKTFEEGNHASPDTRHRPPCVAPRNLRLGSH